MTEIKKYPSVRLTNRDRDNVVKRAIEGAFAERDEEAAKVEDAVGRAIYRHIMPAAEVKAVEALPKRWPKRTSTLLFNVGGLTIKLTLLGDAIAIPYSGGDSQGRLGATAEPEHVEAVTRLNDFKAGIASDKARAKESLKALVYSVRSLRDLAELWPDGAPFYDWIVTREGQPDPNLPAPQIAEINALLGLPKEKSP